jgi:hypothetical protein
MREDAGLLGSRRDRERESHRDRIFHFGSSSNRVEMGSSSYLIHIHIAYEAYIPHTRRKLVGWITSPWHYILVARLSLLVSRLQLTSNNLLQPFNTTTTVLLYLLYSKLIDYSTFFLILIRPSHSEMHPSILPSIYPTIHF